MARVAVFVDAGYFIERGAEALTGTATGRRGVILHEAKAIGELIAFAERKARCPGEVLRVYWYDAAGTLPTAEHIRVAELDDVKLRLGTINSLGQQKGVDSLIIADMIELSRNHASDSFVLVSGDEDLRAGVQVAQAYGIRVHLLGLEVNGSRAQSPLLTREADTNSSWSAAEIAKFLSPRPAAAAPVDRVAPKTTTAPARDGLERAVREFFDALARTDLDDIRTVYSASGSIPQPHDGRLLARCGATLGRALEITEKRAMRRIFARLLDDGDPAQDV